MTPSQLKSKVEDTGSYYFTRDTLKFFGDTMANYGCRSCAITINGVWTPVWELWRKRPVKNGMKQSAYFCKETFERLRERV